MVCFSWMHPRQHLLILLILFLFQDAARAWTFPRPNIQITLPEDYPLHTPFYKLSVILSKSDIVENVKVDYSVKIQPIRKSETEASAVSRSHKYVKLDKSTGIFTLIKRPSEDSSNSTKEKGRHRNFMNITLFGRSKTEKDRDEQSKKCEIQIKFSRTMKDYCAPKSHVCFPSKEADYSVPEDTIEGANLEYLMNPSLNTVCPNISLQYSILSDNDFVAVNNNSGVLQLISPPDADEVAYLTFRVLCTVESTNFRMTGNIFMIDVNDNRPTTIDENFTKRIIQYVKPAVGDLKFQIQATDKDSKSVNDLSTTIENDTMNLFRAEPRTTYETLVSPFHTFYPVDIFADDLFKYNFSVYNFTIVVEDKALQREERKVVFPVTVIRESYPEVEIQDIYEVNISRRATEYSRVLQLLPISLKNYRFRLGEVREKKDWLNITSKSGIVYVQYPHLMPNKTTDERNILWWKKNGTREISGSSKLIIYIYEGFTEVCGDIIYWCPYFKSKESCVSNCGKGSTNGFCSWRDEPLTVTYPSNLYTACSADFETCPDNHCDELEQMDSWICPLDCSKTYYGSTVLTATKGSSKKRMGIGIARGQCNCATPDICGCSKVPPPAEMRLSRGYNSSNKSGISIEIKNISGIDTGKIIIIGEETTTSVAIVPVTDGSCGIICVVLASTAPCLILALIIALFVIRRMRSNHMSHLKVGGSRISLSAVPSDYVQERPNSVQDSRTVSSESSSVGKTVLDPKWEFPRNRLQFQTILGEGEFGKVVKAQASNIAGIKGLTTVAVKMLKDNGGPEEMQDLISEFTLLKDISHPHVIKLLGACTEKGGPFYLIVEYAEMGSLRSYLRKRRKHNNCCKYNATYGIENLNMQPPREYYQFLCERARYEPRHCFFHKEQLSFAWQIAKGMAYLTDMKLIHRDLAARNILLDKKKVAKISDFGLSRDVYKGEAYLKKTKGRVPIKWLAIESLEDQIYTSRSDVWSFGVVLWEIMMQGATPYPGVTPQRLFNLLKAGYRMSKPDYCPDELYVIMRNCWKKNPYERPSFKELVQKLEGLLQDTEEYMDFTTKNAHSNIKTIDGNLMAFGDPSTSIQYTSVLVDNEEEVSNFGSLENIGLVNLFCENEREKEVPKISREKESPT